MAVLRAVGPLGEALWLGEGPRGLGTRNTTPRLRARFGPVCTYQVRS